MVNAIDFSSSLYYSNRDFIPIDHLAESLLGYQRIIEMSAPVLRILSGVNEDISIQVFLQSFRSGSGDEGFVNRFAFKTPEGKIEFINWLRRISLVEQIESVNPTLGRVFALMLVGGALVAAGRFLNPTNERVHIEQVSAGILNIGGTVSIPPEAFQNAIERGVSNKRHLAANAVKVIRPAKSDDSAYIRIDDREELTIPPDAIKEVPAGTSDGQAQPSTRLLRDVQVDIRALDRDNKRKGWAAVVPSFSSRRVRLELAPNINAESLATQRVVQADVDVSYVLDNRGVEVPKTYYLSELK